MRLDDQLDAAQVGRCPVRRTLQQFSECEYAGGDLGNSRILRQQLSRVATPYRKAGGFQADHRRSPRDERMQDVKGVPQLPSGTVELSGADPAQAAAGGSFQE